MRPILKAGVRILRPGEYEALREAIPKEKHKIMFDAALFTGMRYIELQRFKSHPSWYDEQGGYIYLPPEASRKKRRKMRERYVYLSYVGREAVSKFLKIRYKPPSRITWNENLKRWASEAGLDPVGISAKTTRKTWESWLVASYPDQTLLIAMNQGHTELTAMKHYLNLPFTKEDLRKIRVYTKGWCDEEV